MGQRSESMVHLSQSLGDDISPTEMERHTPQPADSDSPKAIRGPPNSRSQKSDVLSKTLAGSSGAAAPAPVPPGGQLPPLRHSESAAASLHAPPDMPPLQMQQLQRAATANGPRLTFLPTPKGTLSSRLDFQLPKSQSTSSLSGMIAAHNHFGSECLHFLNLVEKSSESSSDKDPAKGASASSYSPFELERQRKARSAAYERDIQMITRLGNERTAMLASGSGVARARRSTCSYGIATRATRTRRPTAPRASSSASTERRSCASS